MLSEDNRHIRQIITSFNNGRNSSQDFLVDSHHTSSNAEHYIQIIDPHHSSSTTKQIIQRYSASTTLPTLRPLVTKVDGLNYPKNPCNGYVSKLPDNFSGCLACDSTNHRFSFFPKKDNVDDNKLFWQELSAHIPSTRKRKNDPIPRSLTPHQSSVDIHSTKTASVPTRIVPHITNNDKRPHFTLLLLA